MTHHCWAAKKKPSLYDLSPDEIRRFKDKFSTVERAVYDGPVPVMNNRSLPVSLTSSDKATNLALVPGYVSTITFVDSTGEPWPIQYHALGNPQYFHVERPDNGQLNLLSISALKDHQSSNIAVTLQNEDHPVHIMLNSRTKQRKQRTMDASVVLMIQKAGPHAKPAVATRSIGAAADDVVYAILNQTPPEGAVPLDFIGVSPTISLMGWMIQNDYFIRSSEDLTWPAYTQVAMQGDVSVYRVAPVDMILLSVNGTALSIEVNPALQPGDAYE